MRKTKNKALRLPITIQTMTISLFVGVAVAIVAAIVWQSIEKSLRSHVMYATKHSSQSIEILIREDLRNRTEALNRMANRWSMADGLSRADWGADATNYFDDMLGFQMIEWVDSSLIVQWVYSLQSNKAALGYDLRYARKLDSESIEKARNTGKAAFTKPFKLEQGGLGITVYVPVSNNNEFGGLIVGVFRLDDWIKTIFERLENLDASVELVLEDNLIFSNNQTPNREPNEWTLKQEFNVLGLNWNIIISPREKFVSDAYSNVLKTALVGIMLLSAIFALLTFFVLASRQRSKEFFNTANQLSLLFQNLPGIAFRYVNQPNWPIEFISDGCEDLTGFSASEFSTNQINFEALIHKDDRERKWQAAQQAIKTDGVYEIEYRIETKSTEEKWLCERGQAITVEGADCAYIEGIICDITDRKNIELKLADSVQFSEAIVDTAAEAVVTLDADGYIEDFNEETKAVFMCSRKELIARDFRTLVTQPYFKKTDQIINALRNVTPTLKPLTRDVAMLRLDGSTFPAVITISQIERQEAHKFVALIKDLSKQKNAEEEAHEHLGKLAHIDRTNMLGEMTTGIAHEINQPLTAISVFAQAGKRLLENGKIERLNEVFDKLSLHAQRAGEIIERIQALTRQESSILVTSDCNALVTQIASLAEAESHMNDIPIDLELAKGLANVSVDPVQIQQVVLNLLRNGMEAMQSHHCADGNIITIATKAFDTKLIEIAVIDSGIGVSNEVEKTLFKTFSSTKPSGLGMGLSISRSIIEAHGGSLGFRNNRNCGATFFITLPTITGQN